MPSPVAPGPSRGAGLLSAALGFLRSPAQRAGLLVLACSLVGNVANYLFYVVAAHALSPAQFSDVSAMTSLTTIAFMPAAGIQAAVARDTAALLADGDVDGADGLVRWLTRRALMVQSAVLLVLVVATPAAVSVFDLSSAWVWLIGSVWLVLGLALQVGLGPIQGQQRFGALGAMLAGPMGAFRPLLLLPCVALAGTAGAMGSLVLATAAGLGGVFFALRGAFTRRQLPKVPLTGTLTALVALTAFACLTNTDMLAVKVLLSPHDAGLYGSAALLGKIALNAPYALALVLLPMLTQRLHSGMEVRGVALMTMGATVGTGALVTLAIICAPGSVATMVFGPEYRSGFWLAAPIAAVMTLNALLLLNLLIAIASREHVTIWVVVGAVVIQIVGLAAFARTAGEVVAICAVASGVAVLVNEFLSSYGVVKLLRPSPRRAVAGGTGVAA